MDNANDKKLTFPQRNWLLLCIIVAILSPLVVHWVHVGARSRRYHQATEVSDTANKGNGSGGGTDTSYKVATPPNNQTSPNQPSPGAPGGDSSSKTQGGH